MLPIPTVKSTLQEKNVQYNIYNDKTKFLKPKVSSAGAVPFMKDSYRTQSIFFSTHTKNVERSAVKKNDIVYIYTYLHSKNKKKKIIFLCLNVPHA